MSLWQELRRRNVIRVAVAYLVISWLLIQVGDVLFDTLELGPSASKLLLALLLLGTIPTLLFSWVYELTPEGIKREVDVATGQSITRITARKLDLVTIALLVVALGTFAVDRWVQPLGSSSGRQGPAPALESTSVRADEAQGAAEPTAPSRQSLAVLPFANLADDPANEPFTVGIHDDLLTSLSKLKPLRVISRTSVLRYRNTSQPISAIARELGVAHVLEGGVQRAGDRIRINVQLIDAATDQHLWAQQYDRELSTANIFHVQSEIAGHIATALHAQLSPDQSAQLATAPTESLAAYRAYLAGRQGLLRRHSQSLIKALAQFERAAELDPQFALAYVGQADAIALLQAYGDLTVEDVLERGEPLALKALTLDPDSAEALTSVANFAWFREDYPRAEELFRRAISINPNYPSAHHWFGLILRDQGRLEEALQSLQLATELDPLSPILLSNLGRVHAARGEHQQAVDYYHRTLELDPDFPSAYLNIGGAYWSMGQLAEAEKWFLRQLEKDPGNVDGYVTLTYLYRDLGDLERARRAYAQVKQMAPRKFITARLDAELALAAADLDQMWAIASEQVALGDNRASRILRSYAARERRDYPQVLIDIEATDPDLYKQPPKVNRRNVYNALFVVEAWQQTGQTERAATLLEAALVVASDMPLVGLGSAGEFRAALYALAGDHEAALATLVSAIDRGWRFDTQATMNDPIFDPIRVDPRFQAAADRLDRDLAEQRSRLGQLSLDGS